MGIEWPWKRKRREREGAMGAGATWEDCPHLDAARPCEKIVFHSDYFEVDDGVGCVLQLHHVPGSSDRLAPFWGVNCTPQGLYKVDPRITTVNFEQVRRMSERWIDARQTTAETVVANNDRTQAKEGDNRGRHKARREREDLDIVAAELVNGASYLEVHRRMLVKAPDLETLDAAISRIDQWYSNNLGTLQAKPREGAQRQELSGLFMGADAKPGGAMYFTSTEYGGSYSLVTRGLEDPCGVYVGGCVDDVNSACVLFDVNGFTRNVVIASDGVSRRYGRNPEPSVWAQKIAQMALVEDPGCRVVHLVLDDTDMSKLGLDLSAITQTVDMRRGEINMFEMFGSVDDELAVFSQNARKVVLMAEQAYDGNDADRAVIRGALEDVLTEFYVDQGMWRRDAKERRESLRVVGIPHADVPRLRDFVAYLSERYRALDKAESRDDKLLQAVSLLRAVFQNLLDIDGDLFDNHTTDAVDAAREGRRVVYDFSGLSRRGLGVAMAQLANVVGFASQTLSEGDVLVIHGADVLSDAMASYVGEHVRSLYARGVRVAWLYPSVEDMIDQADLNQYDRADYTILGPMTETVMAERYEPRLGQKIPPELKSSICQPKTAGRRNYIRRDFDNVVFKPEVELG